MGLFDKKYCDVCGEKIGLLGNRKLEDGNLCKDCAKKLSPFFSERRHSTLDEIKQQLAYREENQRQLAFFNPTRTLGNDDKLYVDERNGKFIVTSSQNWREQNPDIINLTQVMSVNVDIDEDRDEITYTNNQGDEVSYNPPRFKYEYRFYIDISVDSPWFNQIRFELTEFNRRPDSQYSDVYRHYEYEADEIKRILMPSQYGAPLNNQPNGYVQQGYQQPIQNGCQQSYQQPMQNGYPQQNYQQQMQNGYPQQQYQQPMQQGGYNQPPHQQGIVNPDLQYQNAAMGIWVCQNCNTRNTGRFCEGCGSQQPQQMTNQYNGRNYNGGRSYRCDKCGWRPSDPQNMPKFCPQCGDTIDLNDMN